MLCAQQVWQVSSSFHSSRFGATTVITEVRFEGQPSMDYFLWEFTRVGLLLTRGRWIFINFISFTVNPYYSGELHTYSTNLKWIWILNSLHFKIRVNKNSHRFVIIKLQDIFGTSKNAFTWKFWPFCFVFISLKNVKRQTFRLFIYLFTQPFTKLLIF